MQALTDLLQAARPAGIDHPIPQDERTEAALLGILLWDREAILHVADLLTPADFFRAHHGWIYAAVRDLYRRRVPPELITVQAELARRQQLAPLGGESVLHELIGNRGVGAHLVYYARIVARHAVMRRLISIGGEIAGLGYADAEPDPAPVLARAAALLASVAGGAPPPARTLGEAVAAVVADIDERQTSGRPAGISTGFPALDTHVYGWEPGQLILLAAQTKRGKTALAQHFAEAAAQAGTPVAVLSLEMEPEELARRHLARAAEIDLGQLRRATVGSAGWERLIAAQATLDPWPIWFLDAGTVAALEPLVHRLQADPARGCRLLIVDYLQLLHGTGGNREQEIAGIAIGLKRLARACQIPVIALSQFSRAADDRTAPQLRDLRESGALEQTANIVLALHRPDPTTPGRMELHILAQRDGEAELVIDLTWHGPTQTFRETAPSPSATWAH